MKIVAVVHYFSMKNDAHQLARSWKYFHPDIPIVIYDDEYSYKVLKEYGIWTYAPIAKSLVNDYDMVIHLDADSIVTSRLDDILVGDFDVAGAKNNNYLNMAGAVNPGYTYGDIPLEKYLNVGVFAVNGDKGKQFLDDWIELNKNPEVNNASFAENGTFNMIFYNGKYKTKILDEDSNPYYYGVSSAWGFEVGKNWQSWKQIRLEDNKLFLRHKQIKLIHKAGAESPDNRFPDLNALFAPDVAKFLNRIML